MGQDKLWYKTDEDPVISRVAIQSCLQRQGSLSVVYVLDEVISVLIFFFFFFCIPVLHLNISCGERRQFALPLRLCVARLPLSYS